MFIFLRIYTKKKTEKKAFIIRELKGTHQFRVYFRRLQFLNGECNTNYFKHSKFLQKKAGDFPNFTIQRFQIKKIQTKTCFLISFSHFNIEIIVCILRSTEFYCLCQFETIAGVYCESRLYGLVVVTNTNNVTKYGNLLICEQVHSIGNLNESLLYLEGTHLIWNHLKL